MKKSIQKILSAVMALVLCLSAQAQSVIFPQEKQPGMADAGESGGVYTLSNELFAAKFVLSEGKLTFGGCEELNLIAGSEIFKVMLGDGTEVPATAFTLDGEIAIENLTGKPDAVKGARRFAGKQIVANFTHESGLAIQWRAVLRDGSHYLRTEMDIKNPGTEGIAMNSITPMIYTVQNEDGVKAPTVVGNTRGAVIASDKLFAGVETPTAYNAAGEATDLESFVFKAWDGTGTNPWAWMPEETEIPDGIKGLNKYEAGTVQGSRGYVIFRETGDCTITLDYTSGNNKLQILGVDILDITGTTVVDSDYHYGSTGTSDSNNNYTITIPEVGAYMVRIFVTNTGNGEGFHSKGTIEYSKKVALPSLVYDLASTQTPYYTSTGTKPAAAPIKRTAATGGVVSNVYTLTETKLTSAELNAKTEVTYIAIKNLSNTNSYYYVGNTGSAPYSKADFSSEAVFIWEPVVEGEAGSYYLRKLDGTYMQASSPKDFGTIDNAATFTTTNPTTSGSGSANFNGDGDSTDHIDGDNEHLVRFVKGDNWINVQKAADGTPKYNTGTGGWTIHFAYEVSEEEISGMTDGKTITGAWVSGDWTAAQNVPQSILNMGYTAQQVVSVEQSIELAQSGKLGVTFTWRGGNHRLDLVGVDLVDAEGNVVSGDYNRQAINSSAPANYQVAAVAGTYTLRYFVETKTETVNSNGDIAVTHTAIPALTSFYWDTRNDNWSAFNDWTGEIPEGVQNKGTAKYIDNYYSIETGIITATFDYDETSGAPHGCNTLGVQLIDLNGNVISEEFKNGFTGTNSTSTYTILAPKAGIYIVRSIIFRTSGDNSSAGNTNFTFQAIASIDGATTQTGNWERELPGYTDWDGTLPDGVTKSGTAQYRDATYAVKAGKLSLLFDYTENQGHNHALNVLGVQLIDLDGNVVSSEFKNGKTGTNTTVTYTVKALEEGIYTVRHIVDKGTNDGWHTAGTITYSLAEARVLGTIDEDETLSQGWVPADWVTLPADEVPNRVNEVGCSDQNARVIEQQITINAAGTLSVEFLYATGSARLNMVGVDLLDATGNVSVDDYHAGYTGSEKSGNIYKFNVFAPGTYTIRYFADNSEAINSTGNINIKLTVDYTLHLVAPETTPIVGKWSRQTTLAAGEEWYIGAVVGVIAPGQARRSFLAYSERERAVPWRAVPAYISWYEININRNNAQPGREHLDNMDESDCLPILNAWKEQLYDKYGVAPYAFVWDDGWDKYGEWEFHDGFPDGFTNMDIIGREMNAGQGAWLGPVGGYGDSGSHRRNYWTSTKTGGMQLSNPLYYEVFVRAVTNLLHDYGYDFRFFKFDGISSQFSAVSPDPQGGVNVVNATGNENAEAIIMAEKVLRSIKEDVFLNTTVGTWASPFWFQHTDAIWRQEKDDGTIGNNSNNRENWITYRDRLVYQNYVQNSPLCPINTLMTHGFIFTNFGGPAGFSRDWKSVLNELRCAFACGSGMVELYNDYKLTNNLANPAGEKGALWGEIAACMEWQKANADVLPDIHWVGGNPWTGAKAEIYGWAAWNAQKAVLTLRNGANNSQTINITLREALDIPEYVNTTVTLNHAFEDQLSVAGFSGLEAGTPIDIDTPLEITLPGSSVFVFDGIDNSSSGVKSDKFYRLKDASTNKYVTSTASGETLAMSAEADASTIFWLNAESELLSYSNGLYLNTFDGGNGGFEAVGHKGNAVEFTKAATEGRVKVALGEGKFLTGNDATVTATAEGSEWVAEEVTSLPLSIGNVGYSTIYSPVALEIPEGITAYVASITGNYIVLSELQFGVIPAYTAVIVEGAKGNYNFNITGNIEFSGDNALLGTIEKIEAADVNSPYTLQTDSKATNGVVMRRYDGEFINAFKMYMSIPDETARALSFRFPGGTTVIEEIPGASKVIDNVAYDLFGRKVEAPAKGIYIINGKKVMIK